MSLATFTSYAVLNAIGLKVDRCAEAIKYREKELSKRRAHTAARASETPEPGWDGLLGGKGVVVSPARVASGHHARAQRYTS